MARILCDECTNRALFFTYDRRKYCSGKCEREYESRDQRDKARIRASQQAEMIRQMEQSNVR
jgi:hypothetical protein